MTITNLWNVGSVSAEVYNLISDLPTALSGTGMNNIIYGAITFVENYCNVNIGSSSISQQYHNAIVYKTMFDVLGAKDLVGAELGNISLGDFSINASTSAAIADARLNIKLLLDGELQILGRHVSFYKANS